MQCVPPPRASRAWPSLSGWSDGLRRGFWIGGASASKVALLLFAGNLSRIRMAWLCQLLLLHSFVTTYDAVRLSFQVCQLLEFGK